MPTNSLNSLSLVCMFWQFIEICLGDKPTNWLIAAYLVGVFRIIRKQDLPEFWEIHTKCILIGKDSFI